MAKKWSNDNLPGVLHFVTGNVLDRKKIFLDSDNCVLFLRELQRLRAEDNCKLIAFVIMPEHFHLVANPKGGDIRTAMGSLKERTAKAIVQRSPDGSFSRGSFNQVWQESFKALPLWSRWMIDQKINYIHANPSKANLCATTEDYRWSSFHDTYRDNKDLLLKVDKSWWWDGEEALREESARAWEQRRIDELAERLDAKRNLNEA